MFKDENGKQHEAILSKSEGSEIILSSGAIGSPQLLLLSGIGPKEDLINKNIPVIVDSQYVGKEMQDNPLNTIFVPFKKHLPQSLLQTVGITKFDVYIEASNGFGQSTNSIKRHHSLLSAEVICLIPNFIMFFCSSSVAISQLQVFNGTDKSQVQLKQIRVRLDKGFLWTGL